MTEPTNPLIELQRTLYQSKNPVRRWLHCTRRDKIIAAIKAQPAGQYALEIGPGSGIYLPTLAANYQHVTASDIEKSYLDNLGPQASNIHCQIDDITQSQLPDNHYDLILCTEVIEHIANSPAALRNIQQLLKPQGVLILSTPQRYSPLELTAKIAFLPGIIQIVRWIYQEAILETGHINLMTQKTVKQQLQHSSLDIISQDTSGFYLPVIAEFGGQIALKLMQWLEKTCRPKRWLGQLLWTQYYIAKKPSPIQATESYDQPPVDTATTQ